MKRRLLSAFLLAALAAPAFSQGQNFQFAPPPYPIMNLRAVEAQSTLGFAAISESVGGFNFGGGAFGGARTVKKWENGGVSLGGDFLVIGGTGKVSGTNISMFGFGGDVKPNIYFDLYGHEEDDFSLPIYFGPHANLMLLTGSYNTTYPVCTQYTTVFGTTYCSRYTNATNLNVLTITSLMYGWQFGIQAGINLGDSVKFVPYVDFSQDLGGSISANTSSTYGGSTSVNTTVKSQQMSASPGFDLIFRNSGFSLGGASQALQNAGSSGGKTSTIIINFRFTKKFRSICGI